MTLSVKWLKWTKHLVPFNSSVFSWKLPLIFLILLISCKKKEPAPDMVAKVIGSMSDTLPKVTLPDGVDPQNENWKGIDLDPKSPVLPLYPLEEAKHFLLPEGYAIEPILTEPAIEQPGAIAFDGDGRMFVLELRTYMLTADSDGTLDPISRISRWEDKDLDGVYETGTTFVDSLIFPRFVLPYGKDCILTMESDADIVYKYTDTDQDGKADKKEFFTDNYGRSGNVEHQQAFMYWGMDNWLYSTVNAFRIRETDEGIKREKTGYNRAQWGITHDDDGKLWFQGGASGLPSYFQFPIHYGNFEVPDQFAEGFDIPWGAAVKIGDMQGGMDEIRQPDGSLNRVTGAAGNDIYRGNSLPKDLLGNYFYGEPVARIVRQIRPEVSAGLTTLHNVHQNEKSEFLRSTDPLFRPVDMATAPDGTMYVVDMYHGIIQEGQWAQKGSFLRTKIEQYQLDKVIRLGRIWRITHKDFKRDKSKPKMFSANSLQLVSHLDHPNGWWRDKAQQLLVLRDDKTIIPELKMKSLKGENLFGRFHALWVLEGMNALDIELVQNLLHDPNPRMQIQALRASESLYKKGSRDLVADYKDLLQDDDENVAIQAMLTIHHLEVKDVEKELNEVLVTNDSKGIQLIGKQILNPQDSGYRENRLAHLAPEQQEQLKRGTEIFNELCVQCHGTNGQGTPLGNGSTIAPALTQSDRVQAHPDYIINTLLFGLKGPIEGKEYPGGIMVGMQEQSDQWIADILSYIRINLDNESSFISKEQVADLRSSNSSQEVLSFKELWAQIPQEIPFTDSWKVSASHSIPTRIGGTASPSSAFNFEGWSTGEKQRKNMWFQIELPEVKTLSGVQFEAPPKRFGWGPKAPTPLETYPREVILHTSVDGKNWNEIKVAKCASRINMIPFESINAKYLKMTLNISAAGNEDFPWSMKQFKVYGFQKTEANVSTSD
ncbi:DUF7133 domain-containing protein [Eudoraea chungangensis]|uniref:DUF7133 domain-containing protein n=1 Tax=Eudoraea chungangensis TaxID=1481905 RepID=UPI0023EA836A|nr:c-type cytochrome [Eudoraea chungangensis]